MRNILISALAIAFALPVASNAIAAPRAGETIKVTNDTNNCAFVVVNGHQPDRPDSNNEHAMMKPRGIEYFLIRSESVQASVFISMHQDAYCGRPVKYADFDLRMTAAKHNVRIFADPVGRTHTARGGFDVDVY